MTNLISGARDLVAGRVSDVLVEEVGTGSLLETLSFPNNPQGQTVPPRLAVLTIFSRTLQTKIP